MVCVPGIPTERLPAKCVLCPRNPVSITYVLELLSSRVVYAQAPHQSNLESKRILFRVDGWYNSALYTQ